MTVEEELKLKAQARTEEVNATVRELAKNAWNETKISVAPRYANLPETFQAELSNRVKIVLSNNNPVDDFERHVVDNYKEPQ